MSSRPASAMQEFEVRPVSGNPVSTHRHAHQRSCGSVRSVCLACIKPWVRFPKLKRAGIVAHISEVGAGGSEVQGHPELL